MTKALRTLGRILKWPAVALAALLLVVFIANSFDEQRAPAANALLHVPPSPYAPEDNAYLAMLGFEAPAGASPIREGQATVADLDRRTALLPTDWKAAYDGLLDKNPRRLAFKGPEEFCRGGASNAWNDFGHQGAVLARLQADNAELLQRYASLHRVRGYYETVQPGYIASSPTLPDKIRCLFVAGVAARLRADDPAMRAAALQELESDIRFWRLVLTGQGHLISKIFAGNAVRTDSLLLADLYADPATPLPDPPPPAAAVTPVFEAADWRLGSALVATNRAIAATIDQPTPSTFDWTPPALQNDSLPSRIWLNITARFQWHFFKRNSTLNALAALNADQVRLDSADLARFAADEERLRDTWQDRVGPAGLLLWADPARWTWARARSAPLTFLYNPSGKDLVAYTMSRMFDFKSTLLDSAAVQRLVRLGEQIRRERIPAALIPGFMARHPEWARHPLSNQSFVWNAADGTITVPTARSYPANRRFWIHVWRADPSTG